MGVSHDRLHVSWDGFRFLRFSDPSRGDCVAEIDVLRLSAHPEDTASWLSRETQGLANADATLNRRADLLTRKHDGLEQRLAHVEAFLELSLWGRIRLGLKNWRSRG